MKKEIDGAIMAEETEVCNEIIAELTESAESAEPQAPPALQAIWNDRMSDSFLVINKNELEKNQKDYTTIISTFKKIKTQKAKSNFTVPISCRFRALNMVEKCIDIGQLKLNPDNVNINLINYTPEDFYPEEGEGWIHFNYNKNVIRSRNQNRTKPYYIYHNEYVVDGRVAFLKNPKQETIRIPSPIKVMDRFFKIKELKFFTILLEKGFIICVADKTEASLYVSFEDSKKLLIGYTDMTELTKLVRNVFGIFPYFRTDIQKSGRVLIGLRNIPKLSNFIRYLSKENKEILMKVTYPLQGDECYATHLGSSYDISEKKEEM